MKTLKFLAPLPAVALALLSLSVSACNQTHAESKEQAEEMGQKIVVTSPKAEDVTLTQQYVCQIHSRQHIEVCALQDGYLDEILVREGQAVKQGEVMFKILPTLYRARLAAERAEVDQAQIEFDNTRRLFENKMPIVSNQEVALAQAKLDKAKAKLKLAEAEVEFTVVKAPFDGIVDRLERQKGSLIDKKDVLTNLSDNAVMWVYFNVPEAQYLDYVSGGGQDQADRTIELVLANGSKFSQTGKIAAIEAKFNNETGNIPFRADFPNPDGLLRHGQTGKVLINRTLPGATVIPQRATFEILDRRYVFVVDAQNVVHQREIVVGHELEDIFVIKSGLGVNDKFVLEGVRQVRDGQKVEAEFRKPEEALANQKYPAE